MLRNKILMMAGVTRIVRNGLVLWIDGKEFINDPPTILLIDKSGKGNDATAYGFDYTSSSGNDGYGRIVFDGIDDYFNCGNSEDLNITGEITLEAKFQLNKLGLYQRIIDKDYTAYSLAIWNVNRVTLNIGGMKTNTNLSNTTLALNTDYHVITQFSTITKKWSIWINGKKDNEGIDDGTINISAIPFRIGCNSGISQNFNGKLYFARVYNRALSDSEIILNFKNSR